MNNYNGFYKVDEKNGGVCSGTFFNPTTCEEFSKITWDIDNDHLLDDDRIQALRFLIVDQDVRKIWMHHHGRICIGDSVKVVKGRKIPVGTVGTVEEIRPYYDRYRRWCCDYVYFTDGRRTNIENCVLAS